MDRIPAARQVYPLAWIRQYGKGRVFYNSMGHVNETYMRPEIVGHVLADCRTSWATSRRTQRRIRSNSWRLRETQIVKKGERMRFVRPMLVFVLLLFAIGASAQTTSGSISGSIVDAQNQVVPGADVVVTNQQTQEVRRTVTNEVGLFAFPALQPGPYTIRAELSGFRPIEVRDNMVLANNRLAIPPLRLEVGTLAEAVTVSAVGEVVATTQTSHQALLDLKQVENLSIRGRDPMSMLKILPGVQLLANDNETVGGGFQSPVPSMQGSTGQTVYVDGINAGDSGAGNNLSGTTVLDAVAEVNVQMSAYTAEYGLKGGSQINVITKHGGADTTGLAIGTSATSPGTRSTTSTRSTTGRSRSIAIQIWAAPSAARSRESRGLTPTATSCSSSTSSTTRRY